MLELFGIEATFATLAFLSRSAVETTSATLIARRYSVLASSRSFFSQYMSPRVTAALLLCSGGALSSLAMSFNSCISSGRGWKWFSAKTLV